MNNKLKALGLAGMITLFGYSNLNKNEPIIHNSEFKHPFENAIIIEYALPHIAFNYETDGDGGFDFRMVYTITKISKQNELIYDLVKVVKDLNGDHQFDRDEVIYENPKYSSKEKEIPRGKRLGI